MAESPASDPKLVRDLMTVGVLTCPPDTAVVELTRVLLEKDAEAIVVLDEEGHALGFVDWNRLVEAYARGNYEELKAEDVMQAGLAEVPPDIPLAAAAQIMQDQNLRILFLPHHAAGIKYPAAAITYKHFLRHMAMKDKEDLADLGIKAQRQTPEEAFIKRRDQARKENL